MGGFDLWGSENMAIVKGLDRIIYHCEKSIEEDPLEVVVPDARYKGEGEK